MRVASDVKEEDDELLDARCCDEVGRCDGSELGGVASLMLPKLDAASSAAIWVAGSVSRECDELPPKDIEGGLEDDAVDEGVPPLL